ncbi:MAG: chloramphenicol acetyltransferase [Acidobacteria bacterium]|nr:chloramphenicol acetyltransferase [Acidobacteriota bacterium]
MAAEIDIASWKRKATFEFFQDFEDPFFNITANIDVTNLLQFCKVNTLPYSLACLFYSQLALNRIREFRIRLDRGKLVEFANIDCTQTILNDDETFSFCYFKQQADVFEFVREGKKAQKKYGILKSFDVETSRVDLVYYSVIPWVSFTSFKHATRFDGSQTVPRIVFGKYFSEAGTDKMPVSVEVNHMIMDGIHVGKYFNLFQTVIDQLS